MIELYYWPTPNGHKITLFLEETGTPYTINPVEHQRTGSSSSPAFLAFSPNNRMPAIIDRAPADGGDTGQRCSSPGAILLYLAEKTGKFLPADVRKLLDAIAVAVLADGRARPDGRTESSLRHVCAREDSVCDRPLRQRNEPTLRRTRPPPRRS